METVGLVTEAALTNYQRRIETMSLSSSIKTMLQYVIALGVLILIWQYGPPILYKTSQEVSLASMDSSHRIYHLNIRGLSRLNKFISSSVSFNRATTKPFNSTLQMSQIFKAFDKKQKVYSGSTDTLNLTLHFSANQTKSLQHQMIILPHVNFDRLDTDFYIAFTDGNPLGTVFSVYTANSEFITLSMILRLILFLISVILLIRFRRLSITPEASSVSNWIVGIFITFSLMATNPIYFSDFFTAKAFVKFAEVFFSQIFITLACYTSFSHLMFGDSRSDSPSRPYVIVTTIPFIAIFLCLFITAVCPLLMYNSVTNSFDSSSFYWAVPARKILFSSILFIHFIASLVLTFKRKISTGNADYLVHMIMSVFYILTIYYYQTIKIDEIGRFETIVFTTATTAIYAFFFMFINWPVEKDIILSDDDINEIDKVDEGLIDNSDIDQQI